MGPGWGWVGTSPGVLAPRSWHWCSSEGEDSWGADGATGLDLAARAMGGEMAAEKGLERSVGAPQDCKCHHW